MFRSTSSKLKPLLFTPQNYFRSSLKKRLHEIMPKKIEKFRAFRRKYGEFEIGSLTVNDVLNGCTNTPILFYEGSVMDPKTVKKIPNF